MATIAAHLELAGCAQSLTLYQSSPIDAALLWSYVTNSFIVGWKTIEDTSISRSASLTSRRNHFNQREIHFCAWCPSVLLVLSRNSGNIAADRKHFSRSEGLEPGDQDEF